MLVPLLVLVVDKLERDKLKLGLATMLPLLYLGLDLDLELLLLLYIPPYLPLLPVHHNLDPEHQTLYPDPEQQELRLGLLSLPLDILLLDQLNNRLLQLDNMLVLLVVLLMLEDLELLL